MAKKNGKPKKLEELKLTETERLGLENCQLKMHALKEIAEKQSGVVVAQQQAIAKEVSARLGIDISDFQVDLSTGVLTKPTVEGQTAPHGQG